MPNRFAAAMARLPLVAILRGLRPAEAPAILEALLSQGFVLIEIPLNSPDPLASVAAMRKLAPPEVFIGAGTVLRVADVESGRRGRRRSRRHAARRRRDHSRRPRRWG